MGKKEYSVGIVPGSFDPITLGHISVIKRAAELCEQVYVAVMINDQKEYMFTLDDRRAIAEAACGNMPNVRVISSDGMLFELAGELSAEVIIKGVRNETDREYELKMARYNAERNPDAKTLLLEAEESLVDMSSTAVRRVIGEGGALGAYLPENAIRKIEEINKRG